VTRGIEAWAADLGQALADRDADVLLYKGAGVPDLPYERVVPCWQRAAARTGQLLRLLPRPLAWRLGLGSGYGIEQATFAMNLLHRLRADRRDILHVQDPLLALIVQRAHRLGLVPTRAILAHGTEELPSFQRKITYLQHLAPWHQGQARAAGHERPTWTCIPNFIDTARYAPGAAPALRAELGIPAEALVVLTAAAIKREHKRIDYLINEVAALRQQRPALPVWLVVAGGRERDTDELMAWGRLRLGDRVRFLVCFPRPRMPDLYGMADVFVLASLREMMPIALLEATASGLPCVVHRHPLLEWMTGPGGTAVDLRSGNALAARLAELADDAAGRRALGVLARQHCTAHFGTAQVVEQVLAYYRFVLTQPGHAGRALSNAAPVKEPKS